MPTSHSQTEKEIIASADTILADWPRRMALVPTTKPLSAEWLPDASPKTGKRGTWWSWSADQPTRLTDETCGELLPDETPYANFAASCCYNESLRKHEDLVTLAEASRLTGESRYGLAVVDLLVKYRAIYPTYPVTFGKDARAKELKFYGPEVQGRHYTARAGDSWMDTYDLQRWLNAYRSIGDCVEVPPEKDEAVRDLTREVIEFESIPNFLYVNDKYHNSLTNYYDALALASLIWGQAISVRDTIGGQTYTGGDLLQMVVNGPKGIRMFAANAFDRNGVYWELSASYTGYVFGYLGSTLELLTGMSDPPGYTPGPAVAEYYEPIDDFSPSTALPDLWRGVLSQARLSLNNELYPPTNDSNYLGGPTKEWLEKWASLLESEEIARVVRGLGAPDENRAGAEVEPFPPRGSTLMPACGAATLRGPANRLNAHLDWHRVQDYHSHLDPLNLVVSADGYLAVSDLGYHLGHPLRHIVSERTAAHNTVTVDEGDCAFHGRGILHHYLEEGEVQLADASIPDAYPQCTTYRRTVVLIRDRYVLDLFRAEGGATHDYALLSRADDTQCSLSLAEHQGTIAEPEGQYEGFEQLSDDIIFPAEPYEVLHHPRIGLGSESFSVSWLQRDRPDLTTRVHHLSGEGAEAILAKAPHRDRRAEMRILTDEIMVVRRTGQHPLRSIFVSVIETLSEQTGPLGTVARLPVESCDPTAVAVQVGHEDGTDLILHATGDGPHHLPSHDLTLRGCFVAARSGPGEEAGRILAVIGKVTGSKGECQSSVRQSARVEEIDLSEGSVLLDTPLQEPGSIRNRFVIVRGATGTDEWWRVASASDDGRTLHLDLDQSKLLTLQGTVEGLENPRVIVSGVNFCDPIPSGTPLRIGPVGDYSSPRVEIDCVRQTGLPLRIAGTTTNHCPRTSYIALRRRADLSADHIGQPFWSSGIEIGDYVVV